MNDYFKCCSVLFFTGIKTGVNPALKENAELMSWIENVKTSTSMDVELIRPEEYKEENIWPVVDGDSTPFEKYITAAYSKKFNVGFRKVIGLYSLPEKFSIRLLEEAALSIRPLDFCIGPDQDGGIYLLGMNIYEEKLICPQPWLSPTISKSIIREIGRQKKITYKLPVL